MSGFERWVETGPLWRPPTFLESVSAAAMGEWVRFVHVTLPPDWDPHEQDAKVGRWRDVVTLPHDEVEHDGYTVPVFHDLRETPPNGRSVWGWPWDRAFKRRGSR